MDASGNACGMVLSEVQEGKERGIAYGAKKYNPAERNYGITEQEALVCILAVKHFAPYLKGNTFKIVTDHAALKWLFDQKKTSGRIARWIAYLLQCNYTIEHRPGKRLVNADGLSRTAAYSKRKENDMDELDDLLLPPIATTYDNQSDPHGKQQVMFAVEDQPTDGDKNTLVDLDDPMATDTDAEK